MSAVVFNFSQIKLGVGKKIVIGGIMALKKTRLKAFVLH